VVVELHHLHHHLHHHLLRRVELVMPAAVVLAQDVLQLKAKQDAYRVFLCYNKLKEE
jgi:hypothetical protein